ncbi:hypothetical protein [Clostridium estertheticum]|uniref:Uncharacterized protein n=1 Tax=Clostridium estertheticum subsp. estertheticum TaxID=1552 RepID=A0A1J0GG14_9CLOT|nr:hypothetical protein [Clostridium estertheticum]APC39912.1 hypothetical protein A7L45_07420 [Clostridium estertheticum subsp. estertheticum]MBU3172423.1 hypothetical protein [Clostridium estertheticum]MBZ9614027.1 hypothetical protein [Clostridium estertheticum subsp. laramiense]WAG73980.1 hypothetical protein LL032_00535 [Clostridium estertheticum]
MNLKLIMLIAAVILGIILNVFIGKIAVFLFKKDGTLSRLPIRVVGIMLIINGIPAIFDILK